MLPTLVPPLTCDVWVTDESTAESSHPSAGPGDMRLFLIRVLVQFLHRVVGMHSRDEVTNPISNASEVRRDEVIMASLVWQTLTAQLERIHLV